MPTLTPTPTPDRGSDADAHLDPSSDADADLRHADADADTTPTPPKFLANVHATNFRRRRPPKFPRRPRPRRRIPTPRRRRPLSRSERPRPRRRASPLPTRWPDANTMRRCRRSARGSDARGLTLRAEPDPPEGLVFTDAGGGLSLLSGAPTRAGVYSFDVVSSDSNGPGGRMTVKLTVAPAPNTAAGRAEKVAAFLKAYDGGACFAARLRPGAAGANLDRGGRRRPRRFFAPRCRLQTRNRSGAVDQRPGRSRLSSVRSSR